MLRHVITCGSVPCSFSGELASGECLPLPLHLPAAEAAGFEVRDVEDWREHNAATLRWWVRRLNARFGAAVAAVGEPRRCPYQFAAGHLAVHQVLLAKPDERGRVRLPRSRAWIYA